MDPSPPGSSWCLSLESPWRSFHFCLSLCNFPFSYRQILANLVWVLADHPPYPWPMCLWIKCRRVQMVTRNGRRGAIIHRVSALGRKRAEHFTHNTHFRTSLWDVWGGGRAPWSSPLAQRKQRTLHLRGTRADGPTCLILSRALKSLVKNVKDKYHMMSFMCVIF